MRIRMLFLLFLFNFCEGYNKIMYNCKHEITLCRDIDDRTLIKSVAQVVIPPAVPTDVVPDGKINISLIRWYMLKVMPNLKIQQDQNTMIRGDVEVPLTFMNKKIEFSVTPGMITFPVQLTYSSGIE